jgi:hypothetical protein
MNGTCPHCGFRASIEAYLQGDDAKAAVVAAAALPVDLHRLVWSYLGLYRKPDAKQVMTWQRAERLIKELAALVNDPQIQWDNGRVVPNGPGYWVQAVQRVLDMPNLRRPLENPNLVRKIAYELAEKAWHQGNVTREKEAKHRPDNHSEPGQTHGSGQTRRSTLAGTRAPTGTGQEYTPVPISEGIKGWRERLGVARQEDGHAE